MDTILISIYAALFTITSIFLLIYFKRLRSINLEYMKLKKTFEDIVFSFNGDLKKIEEKIHELMKKVDTEDALFVELMGKVEDLFSYKEKIAADIERLKGEIEKVSAKHSELDEKIEDLRKTTSDRKLRFYEERPSENLQPKLVGENRALASLTATELKVLEILAEEGEKTVPEIKERIGLTREHTARLMKSLYERGYVERRTNTIPFVYRLAREMEEIIRKKE
ncbi:MAG: helix-turn-helix domain-containing protein [Candidatus Bathyarchaeia archaeon]|nr:MarR family transcriptional regulator [Candidatus Bathyarchaeota archaeon]